MFVQSFVKVALQIAGPSKWVGVRPSAVKALSNVPKPPTVPVVKTAAINPIRRIGVSPKALREADAAAKAARAAKPVLNPNVAKQSEQAAKRVAEVKSAITPASWWRSALRQKP